MKPAIGITPDFEERGEKKAGGYFLYERYVTAVEEAGGIPLILPYVSTGEVPRLVDRIDGLIVTGGAFDIDPVLYGEVWSVTEGKVKDRRTAFEMEITRLALVADLPLLGICGGEQLLNVLFGGSLYQDILEQVAGAMNHERKKEQDPLHTIEVVSGTLLSSIVGRPRLPVNSSHHQSVRKLGEGLIVNARAEDGVVEGIESGRHRFALGVQWHPELIAGEGDGKAKIIKALVGEAARSMQPG
ncbi:MAG: gamma-glutamyl-gamma-aminobutyrate hydrolase family protein [Deltaproteobacteria bacterium]|nr:gamma-glutamyl-gamma-aminobutyrate hydrolase family protein [Deltaproteobacteria bacterium]